MTKFVSWSDIDINFRKTRTGEIGIVRDETAINQSIRIILSTLRGERVRSDLGSGLYNLLFEPLGVGTAEEMASIIQANLEEYENRITLTNIFIEPIFEQNSYRVEIDYIIRENRKRKNLTTFMIAMGEF